jgi:hypothetical protein
MRDEMLSTPTDTAGAVFVGGMQGILDEFELAERVLVEKPLIPLRGPGGAAAQLPLRNTRLESSVAASRRYPSLARQIVVDLAGH